MSKGLFFDLTLPKLKTYASQVFKLLKPLTCSKTEERAGPPENKFCGSFLAKRVA